MNDEVWRWGVRAAGAGHFVTVALAHFTADPTSLGAESLATA